MTLEFSLISMHHPFCKQENKNDVDDSGEPSKVFIVSGGKEIEVKKRGCSIFTLVPMLKYRWFKSIL